MIDLGLEVEAFGEAMCGCSSLGCRVRVDLIGQGGRRIGFGCHSRHGWDDSHRVVSNCDFR